MTCSLANHHHKKNKQQINYQLLFNESHWTHRSILLRLPMTWTACYVQPKNNSLPQKKRLNRKFLLLLRTYSLISLLEISPLSHRQTRHGHSRSLNTRTRKHPHPPPVQPVCLSPARSAAITSCGGQADFKVTRVTPSVRSILLLHFVHFLPPDCVTPMKNNSVPQE